MTIWRIRFACSITKAASIHSDYVILVASLHGNIGYAHASHFALTGFGPHSARQLNMNNPKKSRDSSTPTPPSPNGRRIAAQITRPVPSLINVFTICLTLQWEPVENNRFGDSLGLDDTGFESRQ